MRHDGYNPGPGPGPTCSTWITGLRDMDQKGIDRRVPHGVDAQRLSLGRRCASSAWRATSTTCWPGTAAPIRTASSASPPCRCHDVAASLTEIDSRHRRELGMKGRRGSGRISAGRRSMTRRFRAAMGQDRRDAAAGIRASDVPQGHLGNGRVRAAAAGPALIFDTTLVAARLIYAGVFRALPGISPYILAHTGGALIVLMEAPRQWLSAVFPIAANTSPNCPAIYGKRFYYDTCAFGEIRPDAGHRLGRRLADPVRPPTIPSSAPTPGHVDAAPDRRRPTRPRSSGGNTERMLGLT